MALTLDAGQAALITSVLTHLETAFAGGVTGLTLPMQDYTTLAAAVAPDPDPTIAIKDSFASALSALVKVLPPEVTGSGSAWAAIGNYGTGFANYTDSNFVLGAQYKVQGVTVKVRGLVLTPSSGADTLLATLPVGARPLKNLIITARQNGGSREMRIHSNGQINVYGTANNEWISIDCQFDID